jgi:Transposase DDE domain group 1
MPADTDDTLLPFSLPSICLKKVTAAFDGGRLSSDGGVLLLAGADRRLDLIDTLAALMPDHRDPAQITHTMADILRARVFAIACGYPDADDLDFLRKDPAFKLACGRLPESGVDLASQPTMSRWENAPALRTLIRLTRAMVDLWCKSQAAPKAMILDIDDTADTVHGHQQLSLFNAHHDERCFMPIHIYDAASGHCVLTILRSGKTPDGKEVRAHLRRLVRRIRLHWPNTVITIRGDSHYGRREAMDWCERNDVQYVFGLSGNAILKAQVLAQTDDVCVRRATGELAVLRDFTETRYAAKSWPHQRRVVARGHPEGPRYPLCRHQYRTWFGRMDLQRCLLRARTGRKPNQAPQGPTGVRSNQLPFAAGQPNAIDLAHRRLLAGPRDPRRDPRYSAIGQQ